MAVYTWGIVKSLQFLLTRDGVFSPTMMLRATAHAIVYLQPTLSAHIPDDLRPHILPWIDNSLVHVPTTTDILQALE